MLIKKLFFASLPLSLTFLIHMILWKGFNIYAYFPHIDLSEHFVGGVVTSWAIYNVVRLGAKEWGWKIQPRMLLYFLLIGGTMFVATLWEFHEFIHDVFYPFASPYQLGNADTMHDYFMALLGAIVFCFVLISLKSKVPTKGGSTSRGKN